MIRSVKADPVPAVRVLPRPARIAMRYGIKLATGGATFPRHLGTVCAAGFFAMTIGYGAYLGGHLDQALAVAGVRAGFTVDAITISGANRTTRAQIIGALGLDDNASVFSLNVADAREKIMAMPWISSVSVAKAYPDAVRVELVEKQAAAIWQNGAEMVALDAEAQIIGPASLAADRRLPAFVGPAADKAGLEFAKHLHMLAPELAGMVRAHVFVAKRRWDLVLDNGITIRLPERESDEAVARLVEMNRNTDLLQRDVTLVDLRDGDRIVVGLGETAQAALAERLEGEKKS